ncbi:MAG: hypothetical protein ACYCX4_01210, partial [Bacillota bacterium]
MMEKKWRTLLFIVLIVTLNIILFTGNALALPNYVSKIPVNYSEKSCSLCHTNPPILNDFGKKFAAVGYDFSKLETKPATSTTTKPVTKHATKPAPD